MEFENDRVIHGIEAWNPVCFPEMISVLKTRFWKEWQINLVPLRSPNIIGDSTFNDNLRGKSERVRKFYWILMFRISLFFNSIGTKIFNCFSRKLIQVKSLLNILLTLFNTPLLRPIALQKLDILQRETWYPTIHKH